MRTADPKKRAQALASGRIRVGFSMSAEAFNRLEETVQTSPFRLTKTGVIERGIALALAEAKRLAEAQG